MQVNHVQVQIKLSEFLSGNQSRPMFALQFACDRQWCHIQLATNESTSVANVSRKASRGWEF
jgi:hypothetical protein